LWTALLRFFGLDVFQLVLLPLELQSRKGKRKSNAWRRYTCSRRRCDLKKCENGFHFRVHLTCHMWISSTGRRRIVIRMMSPFEGWQAEGTERLQSRIRSCGWIDVLSICVVL
jgi:hypothetical protein